MKRNDNLPKKSALSKGKKISPHEVKPQVLRKRAEEIARETADQSAENINDQSPEEIRQTIHELRVHQIEMDMRSEEHNRMQAQLETARLIVLVNTPGDFRKCMADLTASLQGWSGCEAVGIRLTAGDDYPYYETRGFPAEFVQEENHLCSYGTDGKILRDSAGNPVLECMCGNILSGRFDPAKPFFTAHGSFWSNNTTALLASTTEADRQARTRNRCNGEGYESVALIPLRKGQQVFGLLQFNDHRPERFTTDLIASFEKMADSLAIALAHRQAEEALRESDDRLSAIIENTQAGYFYIDREGRFRKVNKSWLRLHGYDSPDEVIGKHYSLTQVEVDLEEAKKTVAKLLAGRPIATGEFTRRLKDGSVGYHTFSANPVIENGEVIGVEGFIIDATEHRRMEDVVRSERDRANSYMDTVETIIVALDIEGKITAINRKGCQVFGYSENELIGQLWFSECLPQPDGMKKVYPVFLKLIAGGLDTAEYFENPVVTRSGELRQIAWHNAVLRNAQGEVIGTLSSGDDITERKKIEEALRESEERYRIVADFTYDWEYWIDPKGKLVYVSPSCERITGYTTDELMAEPGLLTSMANKDDRKALADHLQEKDSEQVHQLEFRIIDRNGTEHWISHKCQPVYDKSGHWIGRRASNRDITVRKQAEEALRKNEEKYRNLFDNAAIGMYRSKIDGSAVLEVNQALCDIFKCTREEMLSEPAIIRWKDLSARDAMIHRLKEKGSVENYEVDFVIKNGEIRRCLVSVKAYQKEGYLEGSTVDITLRQQAENSIRDSEEKFSKAFEKAPLLMTISSIEDGTYLDVNEEFTKVAGFTREEAIGKTSVELGWLKAKDREYLLCELKQKGAIEGIELKLTAKDRREIFCFYYAEIINIGGEQRLLSIAQDITERKRTEDKLRESEEKYRNLIENAHEAIYVAQDGRLKFFNKMTIRLLGYSREEISAKPFADFIYPDDRDMVVDRYGKRLNREHIPESYPFRILDRDGNIKWLELNAVAIDWEGKPATLNFASDITDRKRAEEALLESEETYRLLVQGLPDIVMRFDRAGRHLFVSDNVYEITNLKTEQFTGKTHRELGFPEAQCRLWEEYIQKVFTGGEPQETEFTFEGKKGLVIFNWRLLPEFNAQGKVSSVLSISRDITAHRRVEEDYRTLFNEMLDGFALHEIICDNEGQPVDYRFLTVNPAFEEMTGLTVENLIGRTVLEVMPGTEHYWIETYGKVALTGEPVFFENYAVELKKYFEVTAFRPAPNQFACIFTDITERKKAEVALRESEEKFRNIFENVQDAFYEVTMDGLILDISPSIENMSKGKYKRKDMLGKSMSDIYANPGDRGVFLDILQKKGTVIDYEVMLKNNDGSMMPGAISAKIQYDLQGRPVKIIGSLRDIAERKKAEEALRESQTNYQLLANHMRDVVWLMDMDLQTTYRSPSTYKSLGYTREEFQELSFEQRLTPASLALAMKFYAEEMPKAMADPTDANMRAMELEFYCKDGTIVASECTFSLIRDENGKPQYFLCEGRDITERKRAAEEKVKLEAQLRQAQKMESVGRLAGGVAHDFNNMLGVIIGHVEMAIEQVDPAKQIYADLTEIRKAAERSADLTRQLLAFARKQIVTPKVLDLNETVSGMLKMLKRLIGEDIELELLTAKDLWQVKVDPSQIDQIMANLFVNARDAISGNGKIIIETGNISFDEKYCATQTGFTPGEYVRLAVSDSGSGMDKETQSHLFEPFFTTKNIGKGTGLGLATVYGIIKQNNGIIIANSEPGKGTTFTIYLPRHMGKAELAKMESSDDKAPRGEETILIVEDEPAILELARMMLKKQGYTVIASCTPGEAISLAREHAGNIHLLITDVVMPEMNGRDLAKNLLSLYPNLKRLFMSGYTAEIIAHHGVLDEGVYFIQKPFHIKTLADKVREVLDSE